MRAGIVKPVKIVPLCIAALFFLTMYLNYSPYGVRVTFYPLYREIKKEDFVIKNKDFNILESTHFRIYYKDASDGSVEMINEDAERDLLKVQDDFDFHMEGKINLVVYPEYEEMANKIGLGRGSTAMGVYYEGIISILDPVKWVPNTYNMAESFEKNGPVAHELTHYILDYISCGNMPVWFTEGAALYEEYRINGVKWGEDIKFNSYYSTEELESGFYDLDEVKAYKESFIIVKYIGDNYGMEGIIQIAKELGLGRSMDAAIKKVLSISKYELINGSLSNAS